MVRDPEDFRALAAAALEKVQASEAKIAERGSLPASGDLYVFSATATYGIEWALIMPHRDDATLWFVVPFDQNGMVGTWDVAVSDSSDAGSGTLRCGPAIWIRAEDLALGSRSGCLESWYVEQARVRLAAMIADAGDGIESKFEVDDDPEYEDWLDEVTAATELIESFFREESEVITLADFSPAWADAFRSQSYQASDMTMLVAESSGLAALPDPIEARPLGYVFPEALPGRLVAVLEGKAVRLRYFPTLYAPTPQIILLSAGMIDPVNW